MDPLAAFAGPASVAVAVATAVAAPVVVVTAVAVASVGGGDPTVADPKVAAARAAERNRLRC